MPGAAGSRNAIRGIDVTRPNAAQKVRVGSLRLNVQQHGAGPTLLLLHGFPDPLRMRDAVAPRLVAAGFRTVAVDQRGFGESEAPAGRQHYGIDGLRKDLPWTGFSGTADFNLGI